MSREKNMDVDLWLEAQQVYRSSATKFSQLERETVEKMQNFDEHKVFLFFSFLFFSFSCQTNLI